MTTEREATARPVDLLRPGLYVDALDRPRVETPFLFQGFRIGADEEVNTLRRQYRRRVVTSSSAPMRKPWNRNGVSTQGRSRAST
jgi:hypothetical protein